MTLNHPHNRPILVFGSTGQQGGAVASALLSRGLPVRAFVRDLTSPASLSLAATGAQMVKGDLNDGESIREAMRDVYGVFSIQPSSGQGEAYGVTDEQEIRYGKTIADIAVEQRVQHLVYTSVNAAGQGPTGLGHFDSKTEIEDHIRQRELRYTIIRPAAFMELLLLPGMGLDQDKFTFFARPEQAFQLIAVQDIGKIVAEIFSKPQQFAGRTLEIAGDRVTGNDLQALLSQAAGKPIHYQRFSETLLNENDFLKRLAAVIDDGRCAGHADLPALNQEFGHLTRLQEWLAGPGKEALAAALVNESADIALR
jgi:uncharacterized protein YbjT (DUF2867 family)